MRNEAQTWPVMNFKFYCVATTGVKARTDSRLQNSGDDDDDDDDDDEIRCVIQYRIC